jgi:hypothetical protein
MYRKDQNDLASIILKGNLQHEKTYRSVERKNDLLPDIAEFNNDIVDNVQLQPLDAIL